MNCHVSAGTRHKVLLRRLLAAFFDRFFPPRVFQSRIVQETQSAIVALIVKVAAAVGGLVAVVVQT